jgi:hypothetical protein
VHSRRGGEPAAAAARRTVRARARVLVAALFVAPIGFVLHGCALTPGTSAPADVVDTSPVDELTPYLDTMDALATGDTDHQIDVFGEVERAFLAAPTTSNSLRYAAALVTTGHPDSAPQKGYELLSGLLATPGTLTPNERKLASILLAHADALVEMQAENRRLAATVDEQAQAQLSSARRTLALAGENERLREALQQAEQKLNAITDIERSIIERDTSSPGTVNPPREAPVPETQGPPPGR